MHSVIAMDENDQPLTPCITWADNRSEAWAHKIKDELNGHAVYRRTGTPIHPMSPLSKITWIVNAHPEIAIRTKIYWNQRIYLQKFFRSICCRSFHRLVHGYDELKNARLG